MTDTNKRILLVEDEHAIADVLAGYLTHAGFAPEHIVDGGVALEAIRRNPPSLVILDLMLPGMDGIAVCQEIRKTSSIPIIMVTARVEEIDRLLGLECGADDYICKPFSPREVVARVNTVLRRVGNAAPAEAVPEEGRIHIDKESQRISIGGHRLDLTPTEYRLLGLLAQQPGRIYSRQMILELAYQDSQNVSDRIIDSHIKNIRRKIAAVQPDADVIHSIYGVGYRFET